MTSQMIAKEPSQVKFWGFNVRAQFICGLLLLQYSKHILHVRICAIYPTNNISFTFNNNLLRWILLLSHSPDEDTGMWRSHAAKTRDGI